MRKYYLLTFILKTVLLFYIIEPAAAINKFTRQKYNFNSQWLMHVGDDVDGANTKIDDKHWNSITLPHAFNEDEAFKLSIDQHSDTIVWYRKHFKLPKSSDGKKIFLEFEGVRFGADFYINGKYIGSHENGVMAVGLDITDFVIYGKENLISARIDNSWKYKEKKTGSTFQWNNNNFNANYGGIPKNAFLHITDKVYQTLPLYSNLQTTGVYIYAKEINITKKSASVFIESEVRNEYNQPLKVKLEVCIKDRDKKVISRFCNNEQTIMAGETKILSASSALKDLHFWSWGYGYLYDVYTSLYINDKLVDKVKTRTGFRKTRFAKGMVWLNDRVIQLKGYAQRTSNEWPAVGMSIPSWLSDYSNNLMVEGNANLVRWMHVTPWKQDVESCDRVGLIQAMPAGDAEKDVIGRRWEQRKELMRDAIIYNRNNPSILFYESGNESISELHMSEMKAIKDKYDPYGGRAIGSREMLDSKVAEYGGEMLYINKSAKHPMWATEYCRDEGLRKYWDNESYPFHRDGEGSSSYKSTVTNVVKKLVDARAYNRNQDSFAKELVTRWWDYFRIRPGSGKRVSSGGAKIIFSDSNTHFRGSENYRRSGVTDPMRIPKDGYFVHQVMWDGWVDIENYRTYIIGHWNYTPDVTKDIYVVSNAESVELFVNGKSKGFGERSNGFLFTFKNIHWEAGKIEAVSYDINKKAVSKAEHKTAGKPETIKLKLIQSPEGFKADGADMVMVKVEVVDNKGNRCPLANNLISYNLEGPAEWRGGIALGPDNFILSKEFPVECGVNCLLIRSTTKPGDIRLTAKSDSLNSASLSFASIPFKQNNGLSTYIASNHLLGRLNFGETPTTPSFKERRKSIDIINAISECNQDKVQNSFDDNELSEWTNDGKIKTGWIIYELERDADISEIELKLTGWRMRSYPLQIFIDDKEVYSGNTHKSLGYISIPITPTRGRFVKIKLIGNSSENDAFNDIVEVTGNKELDLYKDPNANNVKGQLRIIEVEVYEKVSN